MTDKKTLGSAAALMLTSAFAGAGAMKASTPSLGATAILDGVNVGPDGAVGLRVHGKVGGGSYSRTLNWDATGAHPLIDGQASTVAGVGPIGSPLVTCIATARTSLASIADALASWTPTTVAPVAADLVQPTVDAGQ